MIIEFIGVPASGKTTIATELVNDLQLAGHSCELQFPIDINRKSRYVRLIKKTAFCVCTLVLDTHYSIRLSKLLFSIKNLDTKRRLHLLLNGLYIKQLSRNAEKSAISTVFHQGFIQYIYSVGKATEEQLFDEIALCMLNWRTSVDQIILVRANSDLVEKRLANRSDTERKNIGHISSRLEIEMSERLMSKLLGHLTNCAIPVSIVDSNDVIPKMSELLPDYKRFANVKPMKQA